MARRSADEAAEQPRLSVAELLAAAGVDSTRPRHRRRLRDDPDDEQVEQIEQVEQPPRAVGAEPHEGTEPDEPTEAPTTEQPRLVSDDSSADRSDLDEPSTPGQVDDRATVDDGAATTGDDTATADIPPEVTDDRPSSEPDEPHHPEPLAAIPDGRPETTGPQEGPPDPADDRGAIDVPDLATGETEADPAPVPATTTSAPRYLMIIELLAAVGLGAALAYVFRLLWDFQAYVAAIAAPLVLCAVVLLVGLARRRMGHGGIPLPQLLLILFVVTLFVMLPAAWVLNGR